MSLSLRLGLGLSAAPRAPLGAPPSLVAQLLETLEASTLWPKLRAFHVTVGPDRIVNRKNPGTYDLVLGAGSAAPLYVEGVGFVLDGVDDYIDTGFNPSTDGEQNNISIGYWSRSSQPITPGTAMGAFNGTNGITLTGRNSVNNNASYRVNQATASATTSGPVVDHRGLISIDRSGPSATKFFYNGVSQADGTDKASVAPPNLNIKFGTANGTTFAAMALGAGFIGVSLTDAEHLELHAALATFWAAYDAFNLAFTPQAYSWWAGPIAETQAGRIVVGGSIGGGALQNGTQSFMEIDEVSGEIVAVRRVQDIYTRDDHLITISKRLASGTRLDFVTGHGANDGGGGLDKTMKVASSLTGRIEDFGPLRTITNPYTATNYAQMHQMDSGRVFVSTSPDGNATWGGLYSDDDGITWTIAKNWLFMTAADGGGQAQLYERTVKAGPALLRKFYQSHPTNAQNNIRVAQLNTSDGVYSSGATSFGTAFAAYSGYLAAHSALTPITALAAGKSHRLVDANANGGAFITCEFLTSTGLGGFYYLYVLTGADYSNPAHWVKKPIVAAGTPFWLSSRYYAGAIFAPAGHYGIRIYLARDAAGVSFIECYDSLDNGDTWTVTVIASDAVNRLARPIATGSAVRPVIWQVIPSYTDYAIWAMSMVSSEGGPQLPTFEWPDATNTGATGTLTPYTGPFTINTNGVTIENRSIVEKITLLPGVTGFTMRNCHVEHGDFVLVDGDGAGLMVIEDCTLIGSGPEGGVTNSAILGPARVERCNISACENGIVTQPGSDLIKFNYIHSLASSAAEPHFDGIVVSGGESNLLIEDNRIASDDTSCVFLMNQYAALDDIIVNHNYCTGADSLIRVQGDKSAAPVTNIAITYNVLGAAIFQIDITAATATVTGNINEAGNPVP